MGRRRKGAVDLTKGVAVLHKTNLMGFLVKEQQRYEEEEMKSLLSIEDFAETKMGNEFGENWGFIFIVTRES